MTVTGNNFKHLHFHGV